MTNLDILGFGAFEELCGFCFFSLLITPHILFVAVPLGCIVRGASYYDKVLFKSTAPLGLLFLLACFPMNEKLRGRPTEAASRSAKRLALLLLEVILPSIATSLIQVFICQKFDDGAFLRESLVLACDDSDSREFWVVYATAALVVYMVGFPSLIFTVMFQHRRAIQKIGHDLQQHNRRSRTGLTASQLSGSKRARRSFVALTTELAWLLPRFEKFRPGLWVSGVLLLLLRLLQTSFMAFVRSQLKQAAIVCFVSLLSILAHSAFLPMRRSSDNHVALMAQVLVFSWAFILLLRIAGLFQREVPGAVVGTLLCAATIAVLVVALWLANIDRLNEQRAAQPTTTENSENEDASTELPVEIELVETGSETTEARAGEFGGEAPARRGRASPHEEEKIDEPPPYAANQKEKAQFPEITCTGCFSAEI